MNDSLKGIIYSKLVEVSPKRIFNLKLPFFNRKKAQQEWVSLINEYSEKYPFALLWIDSDIVEELAEKWSIKRLPMLDGCLIASSDVSKIITTNIATDGWVVFFAKLPLSNEISLKRHTDNDTEILEIMNSINAEVAFCSAFDDCHRLIFFR